MSKAETVEIVRERERESYILKNKKVALFDRLTHKNSFIEFIAPLKKEEIRNKLCTKIALFRKIYIHKKIRIDYLREK